MKRHHFMCVCVCFFFFLYRDEWLKAAQMYHLCKVTPLSPQFLLGLFFIDSCPRAEGWITWPFDINAIYMQTSNTKRYTDWENSIVSCEYYLNVFKGEGAVLEFYKMRTVGRCGLCFYLHLINYNQGLLKKFQYFWVWFTKMRIYECIHRIT